jgi:hypothetical protein
VVQLQMQARVCLPSRKLLLVLVLVLHCKAHGRIIEFERALLHRPRRASGMAAQLVHSVRACGF